MVRVHMPNTSETLRETEAGIRGTWGDGKNEQKDSSGGYFEKGSIQNGRWIWSERWKGPDEQAELEILNFSQTAVVYTFRVIAVDGLLGTICPGSQVHGASHIKTMQGHILQVGTRWKGRGIMIEMMGGDKGKTGRVGTPRNSC